MEIIMKVLTFCGAAVFLTAAAAIITSFLFKHYPNIINNVLRG